MTRIYDARGNIYAVVTPQALRALGVDIPDTAKSAAASRRSWTEKAVQASGVSGSDVSGGNVGYEAHVVCPSRASSRQHTQNRSAEPSRQASTDGLLIGPFQDAAPYDLLIVNTDGTLAERSGNGLTIFSQALTDSGHVSRDQTFTLMVHHDKADSPSPVRTSVQPTTLNGSAGFWLDLGAPHFGPEAVSARSAGMACVTFNGAPASCVERLKDVDPHWAHSVFVRIGNPHCVTLVSNAEHLPSFIELHAPALHEPLARIAFSDDDVGLGDPCPAGVNLQWACVSAPNRIEARVFERGEGVTASSGTSASAVACAAWRTRLVQAGLVEVEMPGGTAPVRLTEDKHVLSNVALFGVAHLKA
ncbi:diaminopimelate epimerase [Pseudomonas viridiflava]|uniref:Diaminopimelate epimerase n=1 Tax=Pseudomonas viridiflava TaxID=33069 RepID=A0A3M5PBT8_PSEVI|nr:diaminopimelate epimerase [Pseudomonas viridiflava]RMT82032.1 Diaminopimelate epimerase [Pseudomonas viridiflava]